MNGVVSDHSKRIKKEKKPASNKLKEAREKKEAAAAASMEEGEEGMIISDAENSQMSGSSDSDAGVNPTEKKLIEKYEKYPEYLKVTFKKSDSFFEYLTPFNSANIASATKILSTKSKEQISVQGLPLSLHIQLVPELNILTISVATDNDLMSTDALLADLTSFND